LIDAADRGVIIILCPSVIHSPSYKIFDNASTFYEPQ